MKSLAMKRAACVLAAGSRRSFGSASMTQTFANELEGIKEAGTWKGERIITSPQSSEITVNNQTVVNFCANNYLGLSDHPEVVQAAKETLDSHGFGLSSVRFICGTQDLHKELERRISEFHGMEDTIVYASCFDANAGIFEVLLTDEDAVISDSLNHASIIDGVRLCKAQRFRYDHINMEELEKVLQETQKCRNRLIVTDGSFSMDGDIAPLDKIVALADKYDAQVMIDECHSTGFLGATGRGADEHNGVKVDIINSTLGKALGGATGGYTAGSKEVVALLRQRSRPYLFSNSLAPNVCGASLKVMDLLSKDTSLRDKLADNTARFRTKMADAGFKITGSPDHPICPIMLGDARLASEFADDMLKRGIYVIGFSFPVVPRGLARIRVQVSAGHSFDQIDAAVTAFTEVARERGVENEYVQLK